MGKEKKEKSVTVLCILYSILIAFLLVLEIQMGLWIILTEPSIIGFDSLATEKAHDLLNITIWTTGEASPNPQLNGSCTFDVIRGPPLCEESVPRNKANIDESKTRKRS